MAFVQGDGYDVVVVGAHAMDAELIAGAAASICADRGMRVLLLHVTRGERGHPSRPPAEFASEQMAGMEEASAVLGVGCAWSGLASAEAEHPVVARTVTSWLDRLQPSVVVTHWRGSWHPRHAAVHDAVTTWVASQGQTTRLLWGEHLEDLDAFRPTLYVDVTSAFDRWVRALECYELFRCSVSAAPTSTASRPGWPPQPALGMPYRQFCEVTTRVRALQVSLSVSRAQAFAEAPRLGWLEDGVARLAAVSG